MGNSLVGRNSKDGEAPLGIYDILDKGEQGAGTGPSVSEVRMGNLQVVEEEQNAHGGQILRSLLGNSETVDLSGHLAHRPLPKALLLTRVNSK